MFKVIRDGKVHEFSELHEMQKYINRSKRFGGEYIFTFDMLNVEGEAWELTSAEAWENILWMAERNGDIKVLVEYPEIESIEEAQAEATEAEEVGTEAVAVRVVDGYEVPAGEVVSGLDSSWKSGEQVVAEVKEIYKGIQEKKKDAEEADTDIKQDPFYIEIAGATVEYDPDEPWVWYGGKGNMYRTGFNEVMSCIKHKTSAGWLLYRVKDCHTGSFIVGAGNNTRAWKVDSRKPERVFDVLLKIKQWLAEHGELAA